MTKEIVGLPCIHVGTGKGGTISMLGTCSFLVRLLTALTLQARVSLAGRRGEVIYDTYVLPSSPVESYRMATTGLDASFFTTGKWRRT